MDPLYGVTSWEGKGRRDPSPGTDEEFYEYSKRCWQEYNALWKRYGLQTESCVELGCGAGRITLQLAQVFRRVYGVDVSPGMLQYAKKKLPDNVCLC